MLFKDYHFVTARSCFSILRTLPKFFNDTSPARVYQNLKREQQFIHERTSVPSVDDTDEGAYEITKTVSDEMTAVNGLKCYYFAYCIIMVGYYFQMDLIKKNRWKDLEIIGTSKVYWIQNAMIYLFIDYLFVFSAFLQTEKLLNFFRQQDAAIEKEVQAMAARHRKESRPSREIII